MSAGSAERARAGAGRVHDVDALRGFALLGIVVVNSTQIASAYVWTSAPEVSPTGLVTRFLITTVFATKFYLLFSFLFGYSFTLQLESADRDGARFHARYLRRLTGLFVLGIAHAVLLYVGDILTTYAVLGLVLLAMHELSSRKASRVAAGILGVVGGLYLLLGALVLAAGAAGAGPQMRPEQQVFPVRELVDLYRGDPASVIQANVELLPSVFGSIAIFQAPCAMAMFLLGLAAGKRRLLAGVQPRSRTLRRVLVAGLVAGLPGGVLFAVSTHHMPGAGWIVVALGVDALTAPALSAAYAAALLLVLRSRWGEVVRVTFAPAGRLALTNYLSQSLLLALVFTGYGLALYGRLGPFWVLLTSVAIYGLQLLVSALWVRHFRYGPAEWVLRLVTYARLP